MRDHRLEQFPKQITLAEAAMSVLGERRIVRNVAVEPQAAEPAIGQIKVNLIAKPPLRASSSTGGVLRTNETD
jgi:hypothetical protein